MQLNGFDFIVQLTHEISVSTGTSPKNCCTTLQRSKMRKQKKALASTTKTYMRTNRKTEAIGKKQKNKF